MTLRPCIDCGEPSPDTRCSEHTAERQQQCDAGRDKRHAHSNTARWKRLSARLRRLSPFCELCNATQHLQVDHLVRIVDRPEWTYELANLRVLCRRCNSSLASTPATPEQIATVTARIAARKRRRVGLTPRGEGPSDLRVPPLDKAKFASHLGMIPNSGGDS